MYICVHFYVGIEVWLRRRYNSFFFLRFLFIWANFSFWILTISNWFKTKTSFGFYHWLLLKVSRVSRLQRLKRSVWVNCRIDQLSRKLLKTNLIKLVFYDSLAEKTNYWNTDDFQSCFSFSLLSSWSRSIGYMMCFSLSFLFLLQVIHINSF